MNIKDKSKINFLSATLAGFFGESMNLARIKFFGLFISALCKVQTVCFEKLETSFDSDAKMDSSLWRIQRFMSEYVLDTDINILVLAIVYKGVAFPLLYTMMPKFGNSCTQERIDLVDYFIRLFGV